MRSILVVADGHYYRTAQGKVYTENTHTYEFFKRYLTAFDRVQVLGRVSCDDCDEVRLQQANGPGVEFVDLPDYYGALQQTRVMLKLLRISRKSIREADCILLRVPSATANTIWWMCKNSHKPLALEVVVDPDKYFGKEASGKLLGMIVQQIWTKQLKLMCDTANGVAYVTRDYLQRKYPCKAMKYNSIRYFTSNYSSVCLKDEDFGKPREYPDNMQKIVLLHVCNYINGFRKGHITAIKVLRILLNSGLDASLRFVGDGDFVGRLKELAIEEGVENNIIWVGRLHNSEELRREYRGADLMILPSMGEGLPRVLIEAMAMGLPCLASPVCGIPELLSEEMMIDHDDIDGYSNRIQELIKAPLLMEEYSRCSIEIARQYREDILNERRTQFYKRLRELIR